MELVRLTSADAPEFKLLMDWYGKSFPEHEQRLPESQRTIMGDARYHFDMIVEGGKPVGALLDWRADGFAYVEHFYISPEARGGGLGSRALELLARQAGTLILEIDPPVDDISRCRKGFYERCGFVENGFAHVHPPYRAGNRGHKLVIMSRPAALTQGEYDRFYAYLCGVVMGI